MDKLVLLKVKKEKDQYRLLEKIGEGAFGVLYKVEDMDDPQRK